MKAIILSLTIIMFLGTCPTFASEKMESDGMSRSTSFRPCSSWSYDSTVSGYICRFTGSYVQIPSSYDFDRLERRIYDLETEVGNLQRRVSALENGR